MAKEAESELIDKDTETIKEANISLILNDYNDIFSDFDPRGYEERALSDDFLQECKRAARDKKEGIELRLLIPNKLRNFREEIKIKRRLRGHFLHHYESEQKKLKRIKGQGALWFLVGTVFITVVSWLNTKDFSNILFKILETMLEPAGWFSFWEGLGKIFIVAEEQSGNYKFNKKMSKAEINFSSY